MGGLKDIAQHIDLTSSIFIKLRNIYNPQVTESVHLTLPMKHCKTGDGLWSNAVMVRGQKAAPSALEFSS